MFVAENLNSDEYPEIVGFKGRVQKHSCFDSRMHSGMRGSASGGFVQAMANKLSETAEGARTSASDMAELIFKNLDNVSKVSNNINEALGLAYGCRVSIWLAESAFKTSPIKKRSLTYPSYLFQVRVNKRKFKIPGKL